MCTDFCWLLISEHEQGQVFVWFTSLAFQLNFLDPGRIFLYLLRSLFTVCFLLQFNSLYIFGYNSLTKNRNEMHGRNVCTRETPDPIRFHNQHIVCNSTANVRSQNSLLLLLWWIYDFHFICLSFRTINIQATQRSVLAMPPLPPPLLPSTTAIM